MPNIVNSLQAGNFVIPGVYFSEPPPGPSAATGVATNTLGVVGTSAYGPTNTATPLSSAGSRSSAAAAVQAQFGRSTSTPRSLVDCIANGAAPEANSFVIVRVTDGTDTAATWAILDNTGFATATLTIAGTWAAGKTLSAVINGTAISYVTGTNGDTSNATAAAQLLAAINASSVVVGSTAVIQKATLNGLVITLTALSAGTAGNALTLTASVTGGGITLTASGATFSGGAAPGVLGTFTALYTGSAANAIASQFSGGIVNYKSPSNSTSPVFTVSCYSFTGTVETFTVAGYATAGGGFSATAFMANLAIAINNGTSARAPSQFWSYTVGTSTAAPAINQSFAAASGTDGAAGVTIAMQLGQDGTTGRTGLYALRKRLQGGTVVMAGMGNTASDLAVVQTLDAFCQSEACLGVFAAGPAGTSPTTAVANLAQYNASTRFTLPVINWLNFLDPNSNLSVLDNPLGATAGLISSLSPWVSPLAKPKLGIIGSEYTTGQFPDETVPQANNLGYFKRLGGQWVFFGKTVGAGYQIEDTRMLNYLVPMIEAIANTFLGLDQPALVPNAVISNYASDIDAKLAPVSAINSKGQPTNNPNPQISAYSIDTSPNTPTSIMAHILAANISVQTLSGIWFVLNAVQVGNTVQITSAVTAT